MSASVAVNAWGQRVGYCNECNETIAGTSESVRIWADVHNEDNHQDQ